MNYKNIILWWTSAFRGSSALRLLTFFSTVIIIGALFLKFSDSYKEKLSFTDAVFTAASAVCVAGLSVIDISQLNTAGKCAILFLIQIGGLGIISFSCLTLIIYGKRLALSGSEDIKNFFLEDIEYRPKLIIRSIINFTLVIELTGAVILSFMFYRRNIDNWLFTAIFHSVSAFCNTGLSIFPSQLRGFSNDIPVLFVFSFLIISGGLGFLVLHDIALFIKKRGAHRLTYHSKIVLFMTLFIILTGTALFFILERRHVLNDMNIAGAVVNSFFQTINTRSSGFEVIIQNDFYQPSKLLTSLLMLMGGAPGSIAGGIKITTVFVVFIFLVKTHDKYGDFNFFHHRIRAATINNAIVYTLKALSLLLICICALSITEGLRGQPFNMLAFDSISAFGTVGLTLGITPSLSGTGKWIIIATMFAGRVGLFALSFHAIKTHRYNITYPEGSVLLG
ncbi:MAG: hypothetical protein LBC27_07100 [Spirochaetaceae bacterium]|jgi:trk system potassium uptake protein TrkH|nr:hypothetical protein [Spirochaetaceae bacterium]